MRSGAPLLPVLAALLVLGGCGGSRDQLLADLQSPRPEVRALAVKKLSQSARGEDLVLFTRAAKDLAAIVRAEAAVALGRSQDPRVVDLLGELLEDPDEEVQGRAAMALAEVKNEKAKAYLTLQYGRRGKATRRVIVEALRKANVPGAMAGVVAAEAQALWDRNLLALTEGSLAERVGAAEELGKSGRPEAVNRLIALLNNHQVVLAAAAVRGLGDAGDRRAVGPITLLFNENFPELREAASHALMKLQDPASVLRLKDVALEKSAASSLATAAIAALPHLPETDAALCEVALAGGRAEAVVAAREMRERGGCPLGPILERLAKPATAATGLQAVVGLGPVAAPALPKVLPWLVHGDAALRRLAVDACAEIGEPSAAPAVRKLYDQELKAVQALREDWIAKRLPARFGPGFDPSAPAPTFASADPGAARQSALFERVRALNAARARREGRPERELRPPAELVDDVSPEQLEPLGAILRALGALQAEGALELLEEYVDDASALLRTAALVGLTHLGSAGISRARQGMLEPDSALRKEVAEALAARGAAGQEVLLELLPQLRFERLSLLDALQRHGVPAGASAPLQEVVREGGPEAAFAAELLGRLRARDAVPVLLKALGSPASVARREVLLALGQIGDASAAETVALDLHHDVPEIRAAAATALERIGTGAQAEALDALKGDYYRRVREAADRALARLGSGAEAGR